jgi:hypothetical protein
MLNQRVPSPVPGGTDPIVITVSVDVVGGGVICGLASTQAPLYLTNVLASVLLNHRVPSVAVLGASGLILKLVDEPVEMNPDAVLKNAKFSLIFLKAVRSVSPSPLLALEPMLI